MLTQFPGYTVKDQPIQFTQELARSGEGTLWYTDRPDRVAKVYHTYDARRSHKLAVMVAHPPPDPNAAIGHISYAWPTELLRDAQGQIRGFLMPRISHSVDLIELYHPLRRQRIGPRLTWMQLHVTAGSLASLVWAIHEAGYVLGDMKPQNILVNRMAQPSIIDTDSFQVRDPHTGDLYRCLVGSESFTPAELLGKDLAQVIQTPVHDRFRLGVLLYLLLFGEHPFKGQWTGTGESPPPNELVRQGFWPHAPQGLIRPSLLTIPLNSVHPQLQHCFHRCFTEGHSQPDLRPTPQEWVKALRVAIADLKTCRRNTHHVYSRHHGHCHWCDRAQTLGVDIFPGPEPPVHRLQQQIHQQIHQQMHSRAIPGIGGLRKWLEDLTGRLTPPAAAPFPGSGSSPLPRTTRSIEAKDLTPRLPLVAAIAWVRRLGQRRWVQIISLPCGMMGLWLILLRLTQPYWQERALTATGTTLLVLLLCLCGMISLGLRNRQGGS